MVNFTVKSIINLKDFLSSTQDKCQSIIEFISYIYPLDRLCGVVVNMFD